MMIPNGEGEFDMVAPLFGSSPDVVKNAIANLKEAYEVCNEIGLFTWLHCGTCLGYYRDKDFISHDDDIDLGANISDLSELKQQELIDKMKGRGFQLAHILGNRNDGLEISFIRNEVKIEWFFFFEGVNCLWHGVWNPGILYYCYSKDLFDEFEKVEFKGVKVNVVKQIEKYLEEQYGEWKIPVTQWHCARNPKCLRNKPLL